MHTCEHTQCMQIHAHTRGEYIQHAGWSRPWNNQAAASFFKHISWPCLPEDAGSFGLVLHRASIGSADGPIWAQHSSPPQKLLLNGEGRQPKKSGGHVGALVRKLPEANPSDSWDASGHAVALLHSDSATLQRT